MGSGGWDTDRYIQRSSDRGDAKKSKEEIFGADNHLMSPKGVTIRESRDSDEHPASIAIIIALDETGSMGTIPEHLVKGGLVKMMEILMSHGVKDPQILFMGIGDHKSDRNFLQIGQFESSDELIDKWLTAVELEGNGGGNGGESYSLAWYFAAQHTSIDCFEKRGQKGFLFTIGDEPVHESIPASTLNRLMGSGDHKSYSTAELLKLAQEKYHVFHINTRETYMGKTKETQACWDRLLPKNTINVETHKEIPEVIATTIATHLGSSTKESEKGEEVPKMEQTAML